MKNGKRNLMERALSCIREKRMPDSITALCENGRSKWGPSYYQHLQAKYMRRAGSTSSLQSVRKICEAALEAGAGISMENIEYGPAHWTASGTLDQAPPYYPFLAGFVQTQKLSKIVEVGTWYGGSTQALDRGLEGSGCIVTIDVDLYNPDGLEHCHRIKRITGDAAQPDVAGQILQELEPPIDLLYLDGDHRYESNRDIIQLFGPRLQPQWMILDDIHWQWSMEKLWAQLLKYHAPYALDAGSEFGFRCPGKNGNGFGVVDFRGRNDYRV